MSATTTDATRRIRRCLQWAESAQSLALEARQAVDDDRLTVLARLALAVDAIADARTELYAGALRSASVRLDDADHHLRVVDAVVRDQEVLDRSRNAHQLVTFLRGDLP